MSEESDLFTPNRLQIFREIDKMLRDAKSIEAARTKYRELVLSLVLGGE